MEMCGLFNRYYRLKTERMFTTMDAQEVNMRLGNIIFHIDVNSAYLSWEAVYRLAHKGERHEQSPTDLTIEIYRAGS